MGRRFSRPLGAACRVHAQDAKGRGRGGIVTTEGDRKSGSVRHLALPVQEKMAVVGRGEAVSLI